MVRICTTNEYKVLFCLYDNKCTNDIKAFTIKKIMGVTGLSINKVRKALKIFQDGELISEGARRVREKSYYITEEGIKKVKELIG